MDGCLADSSGKAQQWLAKTDTSDRFGIAGMKETARPLSEYTSLTMLVLDKSDTTCFIEANTATASIINGMARMHLLDEIILCTGAASLCQPLPALSYAETELQYHKALQDTGTHHSVYVRKALAFVRKMLKHISMPHSQVPPPSSIPSKDEKKNDIPADAPSMRWTGSTVDLIELPYGLNTLKYINEGETGMGELLGHFSRIFGLEIKDSQCYNTYAAIKGRKTAAAPISLTGLRRN